MATDVAIFGNMFYVRTSADDGCVVQIDRTTLEVSTKIELNNLELVGKLQLNTEESVNHITYRNDVLFFLLQEPAVYK